MLDTADLEDIAAQMSAAQRQRLQIAPFTSRVDGFDLPAAYAVAELMHLTRMREGAVPVGRKIGFTNREMWSLYGVGQPVWAYLYDTTVVSLAEAGGICPLGRFVEPKIEPEIVFRLRSAPPDDATPDRLLASIDWVAPAFEIVQSHFPGWRFLGADTIADSGLHGTLLLGEPVTLERLGADPVAALESFSLVLSCDGALREIGRGANVLGSPLSALAHLVSLLAARPDHPALRAGEIVTTGTITTAHAVRPGESWQAVVEGLPLADLDVGFVP